jgi:hypothetical protein
MNPQARRFPMLRWMRVLSASAVAVWLAGSTVRAAETQLSAVQFPDR